MKITIQSIHVEPDKKVEDDIRTKLQKLGSRYNWISKCMVYLRQEKANGNHDKAVEIHMKVPNGEVFCKNHEATFYQAADKAFEDIRRQLRKHKKRNLTHSHSTPLKS